MTNNARALSSSFSQNSGKDEVKFLGFRPQGATLRLQRLVGLRNYAQPIFGFTRLFLARADLMSKFLLRDSIIRFAIVRANTCSCAYELADQRQCHRIMRNCFGKADDLFTEASGAFLQIKLGASVRGIV